MKVGLLKCDTVKEQLRRIHGDCSDFFIRLFSECAPDISLQIYDIQKGHYPDSLDECEGYVTTGSRNSVYDNEPWILRFKEFVRAMYEEKAILVGICFGHQMIAEVLGGKCEKSPRGWGIGVKKVKIISRKEWMKPELDNCSLIVSHLDQVCDLPEGSEVLGTSEHCPNAMFALGDRFLGIQGHPEFTPAYAEALMLLRLDRIGRSTVEEARKTLGEKAHREVIARWIENFLKGPR